MATNIRGIECEINDGCLEKFLLFLSCFSSHFNIPWGMINEGTKIRKIQDELITSFDLKALSICNIWELILQDINRGAVDGMIRTYDDFLSSQSSIYILYYDCGMLEVYTKDNRLYFQIWDFLKSIDAQNMVTKTDYNDSRTDLSL